MFTGLIRHEGVVYQINGPDLIISILNAPPHIRIGDSVAINGICLTVTSMTQDHFHFYVMHETQHVTTFMQWTQGQTVNVEFAMQPGDRLDGHVVTGHVMGTAHIMCIDQEISKWTFHTSLARHLQPKGSVAIDGVSLTVVEAFDELFSVCIIPHTFANTLFCKYQVGTVVNIECPSLQPADTVTTLAQGMSQALEEGKKGALTAPPNPWVGCILVDAETKRVVARAHHERPGEPHAEVLAFQSLPDESKKVIVYVTLEPCCHHGRTPPCTFFFQKNQNSFLIFLKPVGTEFLIARKHVIEQVVIGMEDPDPRVSEQGSLALAMAGMNVVVMNDADVKREYRAYIKHRISGMPYVIYKMATTMNGKVTHKARDNRYFTSSEALEDVHKTRHEVQCIFTTTNTVNRDRPRLNVRFFSKRSIFFYFTNVYIFYKGSATQYS